MRREFVKAVRSRYKANGIGLQTIPSLSERRAFVQKLNNDRKNDAPERIEDGEDNWDIEGMVTAKEVAVSGICDKAARSAAGLQERRRGCGYEKFRRYLYGS